MGVVELGFVAVGLSMDAFAAAVCRGLGLKQLDGKRAVVIALLFGGFQGLMPLIGWAVGRQFEQYIIAIDHWIAFCLLGYIGGKMIWDAFHDSGDEICSGFDIKQILIMAIATSIDALAVGITFAFLRVDIIPAVSVIGTITFTISFAGVWLGHRFGSRYKNKATFMGGAVLCFIGFKILLEHLKIM